MPTGTISASTLAAPFPAVAGLFAAWGRSLDEPRWRVDPADEMLGFLRDLHGGDAEQALCTYYMSGASVAAVQLEVLRWRFGEAENARSVLDFASGYGRVTRFLLDELPPEAITASDVLAGAMDHQRRVLGVRTQPSSLRPEELALPAGFDAILVSSLFTHLPEERVVAWLRALLALLAPGGVLAFSTHDLAILPAERRPAAGVHFEPLNEIPELATADYGSTWMDETAVRAALAATGIQHAAVRYPLAVCSYQDLWVVVPDPGESFAGLALQSEPEVIVEECAFTGGEVHVAGWAAARHGSVVAVEALLDGELLGVARVGAPRPDVARARGPAAATSGWGVRAPRPPGSSVSDSVLVLRAVDGRGGRHVVSAGRMTAAMLRARALEVHRLREEKHSLECDHDAEREEARRELSALRSRVAAMEASRFWKLRDAWFRIKRALRWTDES